MQVQEAVWCHPAPQMGCPGGKLLVSHGGSVGIIPDAHPPAAEVEHEVGADVIGAARPQDDWLPIGPGELLQRAASGSKPALAAWWEGEVAGAAADEFC